MEHLMLLVERHGLILVWGNVLLAQAGVPVPAAPTLLIAGAFAAREVFSWPALLAGVVTMSLIADYVWYLAGARFGGRVLERLYQVFALPPDRTRQIEAALGRWGTVALVVAKFIPGFALIAPPIAGMTRVPTGAFLAASLVGAVLWASLPVALGAYHQQAIHRALATLGGHTAWAGALAAATLLAFVIGLRKPSETKQATVERGGAIQEQGSTRSTQLQP